MGTEGCGVVVRILAWILIVAALLVGGEAPRSVPLPPGGLSCCPAVAPAAAPQWARFPAIDTHVHFGDVWSYPGPAPDWTDILNSMDTRNVSVAVDFKALGGIDTDGTAVGIWGSRVNERLALYPPASASRFKLLSNIPYDDENGNFLGDTMAGYATWVRDVFADSIARGAAGLKMRFNGMGVRSWTLDSTGDTLPFDGPWFDGVWEKLQDLKVPIVCHLGPAYLNSYYTPSSDPNNFADELWPEILMHQRERVLRRFPAALHVGAHQGAVIGDLWYQDELLRRNPNYYVEIVAHVGADIFAVLDADEKAFLERFQDQILFATDYMENTMGWLTSYSQKLDMHIEPPESWPVTDALLEKYYRGNAGKLFRLNPTNAAPVAHPGFVQTRKVGEAVTLSGAGSMDFEGSPLATSWTQTAGPSTPLAGAATGSPSFTPLQEGTYEFELTVSDGQASSTPKRVTVNVIPDGEVFQESGGLVVMEAEHHFRKTARGGHDWTVATTLSGTSGTGYMQALPDTGATVARDRFRLDAPELEYKVDFTNAGTYVVFLRGSGPDGGGDSVHVGLDGEEVRFADRIGPFPTGWTWIRQTQDFDLQAQTSYVGLAALNVAEPGLHVINVWMNEDGFRLDKIVLSRHMKVRKTFAMYDPGTGQGPTESPRTPPVSPPADSDGDGLPDAWEMQYFMNLGEDAGGDPDLDGLTNGQEYSLGTNPAQADTDADGYPDGEEVAAGSNPLDPASVPGGGGSTSSGGGGSGGCGATGMEVLLLLGLLLKRNVARRPGRVHLT